jgi:hypothetical protein
MDQGERKFMALPRPIPDLEGKDAEEFERQIRKPQTKKQKEILESAMIAFEKIKLVK